MLRDYQQRAIDRLYAWMRQHPGHPCLVLPTGSGKSHIVAAICHDAVRHSRRVLMLTHQRELIAQNAAALQRHLPDAPLGICSAGLGRRELDRAVTYAGIQSVRTRASEIGHVDLAIIDEAHMVSHRADQGGYRQLLNALTAINPSLRVIGLTATPWRLGHGEITGDGALFDALIEPVSIKELIALGHLAPLRSRHADAGIDLSGVMMRGGEYVERDLQAAVDRDEITERVIGEAMRIAEDRQSWIVFCAGVDHAERVALALRQHGIEAHSVTGTTASDERDDLLARYRDGEIRALTTVGVLTTGFDAPATDCIIMLRPTLSPTLYVQMAGRGMRPAPGKTDCLVLDYAGVVAQHGPVTHVTPPTRRSGRPGDAPIKICDQCHEIVHLSATTCPNCGAAFPAPEPEPPRLRDDDIMAIAHHQMIVSDWSWRVHTSRSSGKIMLAVTYYGALSDAPITEYVPILHPGYAGQRAQQMLIGIAERSGASLSAMAGDGDLHAVAAALTASTPPATITHQRDGRYRRVTNRDWNQ